MVLHQSQLDKICSRWEICLKDLLSVEAERAREDEIKEQQLMEETRQQEEADTAELKHEA